MNIVGPSYTLANRKASVQRSVNMCLQRLEASEKAQAILQSVPGLIQRASVSGMYRGGIETNTRAFAVFGTILYEVSSAGALTARGTLGSSTGVVSMAYGISQVVIVDGSRGYVLTLATNVFVQITDPDFPGANTVQFVDNYFTFSKDRSGQQFQISAINDATNLNALDFASAESSPDDLVGHLVVQAGILLFGTLTTELWVNTGTADFPFERSRGSGFRVGLVACNSLIRIDNGCAWLGRDESGSGIVYRLVGGQPQRISTAAVEQALQASTNLSQARAWTYQDKGLTFYGLNAPGLTSTWVYEVSTSQWHERCDLDSVGQLAAGRVIGSLFAFRKLFCGDANGFLYQWDANTHTNNGSALVRERTTPHDALPGLTRKFFSQFYLDATTGQALPGQNPQVELSWSDDSGSNYGDPELRSLGRTGVVIERILWTRLGVARDRVWRVRFTGNAPFSIISGSAAATQGKN